jgi:hypothetical protein
MNAEVRIDGVITGSQTIAVSFRLPPGQGLKEAQNHLQVLADAFTIYLERNESYKDNWRKMGWKGAIVRIKERADRLWDNLWDKPDAEIKPKDLDDAIDLINFAVFLVRGAGKGETNAGGSWRW